MRDPTITIDIKAVPFDVWAMFALIPLQFEPGLDLRSVPMAIAKAQFARGYNGPALQAWTAKCLPEIDAAIQEVTR